MCRGEPEPKTAAAEEQAATPPGGAGRMALHLTRARQGDLMRAQTSGSRGARAGWAQRAAPGRARWEHVGDMPALRPTEGVAPPPCNGARPAGRATAPPGARAREGGVAGGKPAARDVRRAQSPRAWRVRPQPSRGVGLTPLPHS